MRRIRRIALATVALYAAALVALTACEDTLLFWPRPSSSIWQPPADVSDLEDVWLTLDDGRRIHGWWLSPEGWTPERGALLHCHPKGANISWLAGFARTWRDRFGRAVLLFDYPGFGKSDGVASEGGCGEASDAAWGWLVRDKNVAPRRIVVHGHSLGGAVAVALAHRRECEALLLSSTFTSFPEVAQDNVVVFPARWLCRNQFRSIDLVPELKMPVFIAHGTHDRRIPFSHGERLYAAVGSERKRFVRVDGGTHDLIVHPAVVEAMAEFLKPRE